VFGGTTSNVLVPLGPVTVTSASSVPVFATTTAKSKMLHTLFAVTVGQ